MTEVLPGMRYPPPPPLTTYSLFTLGNAAVANAPPYPMTHPQSSLKHALYEIQAPNFSGAYTHVLCRGIHKPPGARPVGQAKAKAYPPSGGRGHCKQVQRPGGG